VAGVILLSTRLGAEVPFIPEYNVGDKAEADVVTPVALIVFDPVLTANLRQAEAQRVPLIFRFDPSAARQSEEALRASFSEIRGRFLDGLQTRFDHRPPLLTAELAQAGFSELVSAFRESDRGFPITTNLAELWALGDSGDVVLAGLLGKLRGLTNAHIRSDAWPQGEKLGTGSVRLIAVQPTQAALTLGAVDRQGSDLARTSLVSLTKTREEAQKEGQAEDQATLQFVAGFLRPNCFFDDELTQRLYFRHLFYF